MTTKRDEGIRPWIFTGWLNPRKYGRSYGMVRLETREDQILRETSYLRAFQARADAISRLIVSTDLPWVDILIHIERLRVEARRLFPLKMDLFEMVYAHRYRRLWDQWRA